MTTTNLHSFTLRKLYLDELPRENRDLAEREIRGVLEHFERLADKLELEQDVQLDVILTGDMGPHVDRIERSYGKAPVGLYQPIRNTVVAQGITLTDPAEPPLRASVILNQESWTKDDGESVAIRAYLLLHEIGHVLQQARGTGADWKRAGETAATYEEQVRREARILWDEFDADIVADQICRDFLLRNDEGKPIGAGEFFVNRFAGSAADLLERLCAFVHEDVEAHRLDLGPLDPLYPTAFGLLRELLRVLAHTVALCVGMQSAKDLTTSLEALRGFNEYIAEDWQAFLDALAENSGQKAEPELARIWNAIMDRLGLEIEDLPDGRQYVHVFEPVFCCDSAVDDGPDDSDCEGDADA